MRTYLFFILYNLLWLIAARAQSIDSLLLRLNEAKSDTDMVKIQARLSWEYRNVGNYSKAIDYGEKALFKAEKLHFNSGIAHACNALGAIYDEKGQYPKSLTFYTRAMRIHEQLHDSSGICRDYNNIGLLHENLSNYTTALAYYDKALKIAERLKNKRTISAIYFNIGAVYTYINKYDTSSGYYFRSLEIDKELNDEVAISDCYTNIGINYTYMLRYEKAVEYCTLGLKMKQKLDDQNGIAASCINLGDIYLKQDKYDQAKVYFTEAFNISLAIGAADNLRLAYEGLATINYATQHYKEAYDYHVKFKQLTDSMFNSENSEELNQIKINYELEKKEIEQAQVKALSDSDKKRQNIIILSVIIVLLTVCVFSLFLYKRFRVTNSQKEIISQQKELVEEKQKEISDSINYAKRIQTSFLANKAEFEKHFSEHFIVFKPKDVVSGDFYWACSVDSTLFICVADSTGHGIPGAFMSLLNISLLNEAVLSRNYTSTVDILNFVRRILILGLKPDETGQGGNDGMDCVLFSIDLKSLAMEFSGANNPLWIIRHNELIELNADKMPVGRSPRESDSFTAQKFQLQKGDLILSFTDGYADQFGGPKGKKFKYKQLESLLKDNCHKSLAQQKEVLNSSFESWRGNLEQVDDVTIIGIKI
jgi:serine phosphatase RsbU (regulator of sigma subunit)/Tfp pilus assembly protein PilF